MRLATLMSAAALLAACGDSTAGPGNIDAGVDAAPAAYAGLWRLTSASFGSDAGTLTITDENQQLTDPENGEMHVFRINGTMQLAGNEIAYAQQRVVDDAIPLTRSAQPANFLTRFTASGADTGTFALEGGLPTVGFVYTHPPDEKLQIQFDTRNSLELRRTTHAATDAMQVRGRITL